MTLQVGMSAKRTWLKKGWQPQTNCGWLQVVARGNPRNVVQATVAQHTSSVASMVWLPMPWPYWAHNSARNKFHNRTADSGARSLTTRSNNLTWALRCTACSTRAKRLCWCRSTRKQVKHSLCRCRQIMTVPTRSVWGVWGTQPCSSAAANRRGQES